ncbi:hypothetical protein OIO90_004674 [Microbotryomycetes sp. JL221]|nr:hypothetical protein OIO90_004674 [Microbotryomycetes sp. JL221]
MAATLGAIAKSLYRHVTSGSPEEYKSLSLKLQLIATIMRTTDETEATKITQADQNKFDFVKHVKRKRQRLETLGASKPKRGVVIEINVPVTHDGFKGELATEPENGDRHLEAEWQLSDQVVSPRTDRMVLYIHGGGYSILSRKVYRPLSLMLSQVLSCPVLSTDYRLAPEHPYPAALQDVVALYLYLTNTLQIPSRSIILAGDSSGAAMCLGLMLYLRDYHEPQQMPSSSILFSPSCDLTRSFKSLDDNQCFDALFEPSNDCSTCPGRLYLSQNNQEFNKLISKPYVSASLAQNLHGLPKLLILSGSNEVLRDEATLLSHRASRQGVQVQHDLYDNGIHSFVVFVDEDIAVSAFDNVRTWAKKVLDSVSIKQQENVNNQSVLALRDIVDRLHDKRRGQGWSQNRIKSDERKPKWIFEADLNRLPPEPQCRSGAHVEAQKAVANFQQLGLVKGVSTVWTPKRNTNKLTITL